jgi:hypothetical protein
LTGKPYVHTYTELLDDLPAFSRGSKLNILVCIGLSQATGTAPDFSDIVRITRLSIPTVEKYLDELKSDGMVKESNGKYSALKYFSFNKRFSSVISNISTVQLPSLENFDYNCTYINGQKLFEKKTTKKKDQFPPRTPMATYLSQQRFFGKEYIKWRGFSSADQRDRWEQVEHDYSDKTIQSKIAWGITALKPSNAIEGIITALTKHIKPDRPPEPIYTDNSLSSDIAIEIPKPTFGKHNA